MISKANAAQRAKRAKAGGPALPDRAPQDSKANAAQRAKRAKRRRLLYSAAAVLLAGALGAWLTFALRHEIFRWGLSLPPFTHGARSIQRLTIPMRDGVALQTQVHLPSDGSSFPTIVIRNPYNFGDAFAVVCGVFARYGYACVHQDVRGRMGSPGEWRPMVNEREDGIDTLAWVTKQPFCDGNIALYGMSYLAAVQWSMADALPEQVKTLVPMVFGTDAYAVQYSGGMFRHEIFTAWAALMPDSGMRFDHADEYAAAVRHRPPLEVDERFFGIRLPWYREWITQPSRTDPLWQDSALARFQGMPERTTIPVLMIGGWYDLFLAPQLEDFRNLASRSESRFVIGPWHHLQRSEEAQPGDFGLPGQWRQVLNWLDHHLRGGPLEGPTGVIQMYVYGEGKWQDRPTFPPPAAHPRRFALRNLHAATECPRLTPAQCGALAAEAQPPDDPEATQASVAYRYDPDDPVPSQGGANMLAFGFQTYDAVEPGPRTLDDAVRRRPDVLTFVSEPLKRPLKVAGGPLAMLRVSSSAPDTAFTAKLIEVRPDGRSIHVRDSIRSLAYRDGRGDGPPRAYEPSTEVDLPIEMWPIAWTFSPGSRIRLDVSSSNFPVYHAHSNRAGLWAEQTGADVATNRVHAGSALFLPVEPG